MAVTNTNPTLAALMGAALALPALNSVVHAATPTTQADINYHYNNYREGAIPSSKLARGGAERYTVDTHQIDITAPLNVADTSLEVALQHEVMSGASPWYIEPDAEGNPVQVMSGATSGLSPRKISEERNSVQAKLNAPIEEYSVNISGGYSKENDYKSYNVGAELTKDINQGMTSLELGTGYVSNTIEPTDASKYQREERYHSNDKSLYVGLTQIINARSLIQFTGLYSQESGFLSDPYKWIKLGNQLKTDSRPDKRRKFSFTARYRYHIEPLNASIHTDYRYFQDSWGIAANTVTLSWYQSLNSGFTLTPRIRYYSQSNADFYLPFSYVELQNKYHSSDYRLSAFGSISLGVNINKKIGNWRLNAMYENYRSGTRYALNSVAIENPGLVNFQVISLSINYLFGD